MLGIIILYLLSSKVFSQVHICLRYHKHTRVTLQKYHLLGSPGLVGMGGDSGSEGRGFD